MGGLAPGPNPLNAAAYLMQTLNSGQSFSMLSWIQCCKIYLFRPMGGLAPGPNPLNAAAYLMQTLNSGQSFSMLSWIQCCKIYLFRPTSEFPSLWLPLLIRKHQRMRNCEECFQRNLPTNIFSSLVLSKISKQKSYKFVL